MKQSNKKKDFLGTSVASLLGNLWTGKGVKRSKIPGKGVLRAGERIIRAGQDFQCHLIL